MLVLRFTEMMKKLWNPKNFKGHVSPHELLLAISNASDKRFKIGEQKDPIQLLAWFFTAFKSGLKKGEKVVDRTFQGELEIAADGKVVPTKFFYLSLDLPNIPLFKE